MLKRVVVLAALVVLISVIGYRREQPKAQSNSSTVPASGIHDCESFRLIMLSPKGDDKVDQQIRHLQNEIRKTVKPAALIERLGWLYVAKARYTDEAYYKLVAASADCLELHAPGCPEGLLLRGYVLQSAHRFQEAEKVALELIQKRRLATDHGLLGDALLEQGKLVEAAEAYQKMSDLKPGHAVYTRAAHMCWLRGDLDGAREFMQMAAKAGGSTEEPQAVAWTYTQIALYELQGGDLEAALQSTETALRADAKYAKALFTQGRVLLALGKQLAAVEAIKKAAELNPLPEYQWLLADALRGAGRKDEALAIDRTMSREGLGRDARTMALYLATRNEQTSTALALAQHELTIRADVHTLDALAWSLHANGKLMEARAQMDRALAEGTVDARLFLHAGVIAAAAGKSAEAAQWLKKAQTIHQMLYPSEQHLLAQRLASVVGAENHGLAEK